MVASYDASYGLVATETCFFFIIEQSGKRAGRGE